VTTFLSVQPTDDSNASSYTVVKAASRWLDDCLYTRGRSQETIKSYTSVIAAFCDLYGTRLLAGIDRNDLRAFIDRSHPRCPKPSPATKKREISTLRSFFVWCVEEELLDRSPALSLHAPKMVSYLPRPIPDEVWREWWGHDMPVSLRCVLGFGYFCGLRRAEIARLVPEQVTDRLIVSFVRKGGGDHTLPWRDMYEQICDHLPGQVVDPSWWIESVQEMKRFGAERLTGWASAEPGEVNKRIGRWGERNGLPSFTPHQLRHSAATNLVRTGVPLHLVKSLMNHSSLNQTTLYVAAGGAQLREFRNKQRDENDTF
jgi:site-specific recombinase XerD